MHAAQCSIIKMIRVHLQSGFWRYYHRGIGGNAGTGLGALRLKTIEPSIYTDSVAQDLYTPLRWISAQHTEIIDRL